MFDLDYFADSTPAPLEEPFTLGEIRAIAVLLNAREACRGRCGNPECELMGYARDRAMQKLVDAAFEAGDPESENEHSRDLRATAMARMDQWQASLSERGLL